MGMDAEIRCKCTCGVSELKQVLSMSQWKTEYAPINKQLLP